MASFGPAASAKKAGEPRPALLGFSTASRGLAVSTPPADDEKLVEASASLNQQAWVVPSPVKMEKGRIAQALLPVLVPNGLLLPSSGSVA